MTESDERASQARLPWPTRCLRRVEQGAVELERRPLDAVLLVDGEVAVDVGLG